MFFHFDKVYFIFSLLWLVLCGSYHKYPCHLNVVRIFSFIAFCKLLYLGLWSFQALTFVNDMRGRNWDLFCSIRTSGFSNTICWKDYPFPIKLPLDLYWKSFVHIIKLWVFCFTDLFVCVYANMVLFTGVIVSFKSASFSTLPFFKNICQF